LDRDRYGQEIAAAWIGKEKLRDALNLRARLIASRASHQARPAVLCTELIACTEVLVPDSCHKAPQRRNLPRYWLLPAHLRS
jgi:hypothetical protein